MDIRNRASRLYNLTNIVRTYGFSETFRRVLKKYLGPIIIRDHIRISRIAAGRKLERILGSQKVQHGPFKGLNLENFLTWGASDRASQLLGLYEREVVSLIAQEGGPDKVFVDVGAAEGYFAAGVLVNGHFNRVIGFEADEKSRQALAKTLNLNGVADRASLHGTAGDDFVLVVGEETSFDFKNTVFLIDIEGGEIGLLTQSNLEQLSEAMLIVETHPVKVTDDQIRNLEILCSLSHQVSEIVTGERDPGFFSELTDFTDDERWILCSEGRDRRGRWLVLRPKADKQET